MRGFSLLCCSCTAVDQDCDRREDLGGECVVTASDTVHDASSHKCLRQAHDTISDSCSSRDYGSIHGDIDSAVQYAEYAAHKQPLAPSPRQSLEGASRQKICMAAAATAAACSTIRSHGSCDSNCACCALHTVLAQHGDDLTVPEQFQTILIAYLQALPEVEKCSQHTSDSSPHKSYAETQSLDHSMQESDAGTEVTAGTSVSNGFRFPNRPGSDTITPRVPASEPPRDCKPELPPLPRTMACNSQQHGQHSMLPPLPPRKPTTTRRPSHDARWDAYQRMQHARHMPARSKSSVWDERAVPREMYSTTLEQSAGARHSMPHVSQKGRHSMRVVRDDDCRLWRADSDGVLLPFRSTAAAANTNVARLPPRHAAPPNHAAPPPPNYGVLPAIDERSMHCYDRAYMQGALAWQQQRYASAAQRYGQSSNMRRDVYSATVPSHRVDVLAQHQRPLLR